jgi:hypothetical protein
MYAVALDLGAAAVWQERALRLADELDANEVRLLARGRASGAVSSTT